MMPWEHAAIGYIGYSILVRVFYKETPTAMETVAVVFGSLFPDLIDKPLAWQFDLFASGYAFAHSIFTAVPIATVVVLLAWRHGAFRTGLGFAVGYLLHIPGDMIPPYIQGEGLAVHRALWPFRQEGSGYDSGFGVELSENLVGYASWFIDELASGNPDPYLFVVVGIGVIGLLLWIADGMPIARETYEQSRVAFRN